MTKQAFFFFSLLLSLQLNGQNWEKIIPGELNKPPRSIYQDSVTGILYIGGSFQIVDDKSIEGVAKFDGLSWDSLGIGTDGLYGGSVANPTLAFCRYHDYLYVGGAFHSAGDKFSKYLARWDGNVWDSIPCPNSSVSVLKVINDLLYVGGTFDTVGNLPALNLAVWDGNSWSNVPQLPTYEYSSKITGIEYFNNEIYVIGSFCGPDSTLPNRHILRWDGANWKTVGNGMRGLVVVMNKIIVFQNELYVAGTFYKAAGNAGNNIQKWDGYEWSEVGGGTSQTSVLGSGNGNIFQLIVYHDELYAAGQFCYAGGIPALHIAKWDGQKWCALGGAFDNVVSCMGIYNDTLLIGGGFWTIDGDSIQYFAKWVGGDYVDTCSTPIIDKVENIYEENQIVISPNPSSGKFQIYSSEQFNRIEVFNMLGKRIYISEQTISEIDLSKHPSGLYFLCATGNSINGKPLRYSQKMLKE